MTIIKKTWITTRYKKKHSLQKVSASNPLSYKLSIQFVFLLVED